MFNPIQNFELGKSRYKANTFIGGVGATINTKELIASRLGLPVSRIKAFKVVGNDIEFAVTGGTYILGNSAFQNDQNITYFNDKSGLILGNVLYGFTNATNLEYLYLLNITSLGSRFCKGCTKLKEVRFASLINTAGEDFEGCTKLEIYGNSFSRLTNVGNATFRNCTLLIGNLVFDNLTTVGNYAFQNTNITGFSAPNLTTVGMSAFHTCQKLTNINIPLVISLNSNSFFNCIELTGDLVLNNLTSVGDNVFNSTKITGFVAPNLITIGSGIFNNVTTLVGILEFNNLTSIGSSAFGNTNITGFIAPNVTNIGNLAFFNCTLLAGDLVFNNLISIGSTTFYGNKITSFTAINVKNIGYSSFSNCLSITNINIPNVENLGTSNLIYDNIFNYIKFGCTITVPVAMKTINNGSVEPDLQYAITSRTAIVNYV